MEVGRSQRFFGHNSEACAGLESVDEIRQARAYHAAHVRLCQHGGSDFRVPSGRGEDQPALRQVRDHSFFPFPIAGPSPIIVGTPLSTPWKLVSGSPSAMPPAPIRYSRIVSSWALVRFLTTDIARLT